MRLTLLVALAALLGMGCTALVDGTLAGRGSDAGLDAGPPPDGGPDTGPMPDAGPLSACAGLADGLHCTMTGIDEPFVCIGGACVLSRCGDGAPDVRVGSTHTAEECDDGNATSGDGCESDCTFSCHASGDCDDALVCNGVETCGAMHFCEAGTPVPDAPPTTCTVDTTTARCQGGVCRAGMCGDGTVDAGEDCDDHNLNDGDGCDADCTYTCIDDAGCQNADLCDGSETCNVAAHTCVAATIALACDDMNACTNDTCDPATGCHSAEPDVDGDGFAAIAGSCGDDCNDNDPAVHPTAVEPCGSSTDLNCDGMSGPMTRYYRDCDGDEYASSTAAFVDACAEPAAVSGCSGGWTTRAPTTTSTSDCLDSSLGYNAHPGQLAYYTTNTSGLPVSFDYNCSGTGTLELPRGTRFDVAPSTRYSTACIAASGTRVGCDGDQWYVASANPACGASVTVSYCTGTFVCTRTTRTTTAACH